VTGQWSVDTVFGWDRLAVGTVPSEPGTVVVVVEFQLVLKAAGL